MPFSAINTYEQELKQRNERHTLELQLEQAMQVYQQALEAQRVNNIEEAHEHYVKLFSFDVLEQKKIPEKADLPDEKQNAPAGSGGVSARSLQLGPAIRLRAMALKNFALLLLTGDDVPTENVNQAFKFLGEALDLIGTDDRENLVVPSLVTVSWAVGCKRIVRLGLEIMVQNEGGSSITPLEEWLRDKDAAKYLFGPRVIDNLRALDYIIEEQTTTTVNSEVPRILRGYESLRKLASRQEPLAEKLESESKVEISLAAKSWESLISSLSEAVLAVSRKSKRKQLKDGYAWSQKDMWNVEFVGTPFQRHEILVDDGMVTDNISDNETEPKPSANVITTPPAIKTDVLSSPLGSPKPPHHDTPVSPTPSPHAQVSNSPKGEDLAAIAALITSPVKRRRIDRVKRSTLALPSDFGNVDANFAAQFNAYLSLIENPLVAKFLSPAQLFLNPSESTSPSLLGAAKLRDILTSWDSRESTQFLTEAASTKRSKGGMMTTLRKGIRGEFGDNTSEDEDEEDLQNEDIIQESLAVEKFVTQYNNLHIQQIRWFLSRTLLQVLASGSQKKSFALTVFKFIDEFESLIWAHRRELSRQESLVLFALYADRWMIEKTQDLEIKVMRWQLVSSAYPSLTQSWVTAFVYQESEAASPESSVIQFEGIYSALEGGDSFPDESDLTKVFYYLNEIPELNIANLQVQISKFKAAAAFERVLTPPELGDGPNKSREEDIKLLEAMLMPDTHAKPESTSDSEFEAIQNFLGYAQPQFKMGLWYILLEKYEAAGSSVNSFLGLTQIFTEAIKSLETGEPLLQVLSVTHDVGKRLVPLLERNPDLLSLHWNRESALTLLIQIQKLLQTLHLFLLYDDAVNSNLLQKPITPSWPKALIKFRELVVMWWCIFYRIWLRCIPDKVAANQETVNDILSIIHERLGNLGYCGVANYCLLNLHLSEIVRIDWEGSALDMSQCLKCKFNLNLSLYGDLANHHTITTTMTEKEASMLLASVMRMILKHRSFHQIVMRMDTRTVLDEFSKNYKIKERDDAVERRIDIVKNYLSSDFSPELLRRAWSGCDDTKMSIVDGDDAHALWLVQAGVLVNQYKMRRRQAYASSSVKTETLENAIDLYIADLAAKPTRLESWAGIAQCYLYICEDCLIFGDELALDNTPALYCQRALIAGARAISLLVREKRSDVQEQLHPAQRDSFESVKTSIWSLFGYTLLLAVMPPLKRLPFATSVRPLHPLLVELSSSQTTRLGISRPHELEDKIALRIALRCLSKHPDPQQKWISYMHQTLVAFQLDLGPSVVLHSAKLANDASPHGVFDAFIEVIHISLHYYREQRLTDDEVRKTLSQATPSSCPDEGGSVIDLAEAKLRWLMNKNKWLHRPRYLLAKIAEVDRKDTVKAQQELMLLFTLKSPTKPLVIWKTDSDLPGQHGVYMTQYIRYMVDLMYTNRDSVGLLLMAKRFRKTGAEMWNHTETYEYIYGHVCRLVHEMLPTDSSQRAKYSDVLMADIADNSEKFDTVVKLMTTDLDKGFNEKDEWTLALYYVVELRRSHSGPSTIAQADELLIIIFLTIYKKYVEANASSIEKVLAEQEAKKEAAKSNSTTDSTGAATPAPKKSEKPAPRKKVIRKDVIHSAQQYLKPVQSTLAKLDDLHMPSDLKL